jgi:hypothetical protein
MRFRSLAISAVWVTALMACVSVGACTPADSPRPVGACTDACNARASAHCSEHDCARGCTFVLDRLVEHEQEAILSCVSRTKAACDDALWAYCAVNIGVHADGGPPAPPLPEE